MSELTTCKKCGKEVYLFTGKTSGKRYYCDSDKYNDFHKCGQSRQETSTSPQQTLPLQNQQKEEKTENVVVSPELTLESINKMAIAEREKRLGGLYDSANEKEKIIYDMHFRNEAINLELIKTMSKLIEVFLEKTK